MKGKLAIVGVVGLLVGIALPLFAWQQEPAKRDSAVQQGVQQEKGKAPDDSKSQPTTRLKRQKGWEYKVVFSEMSPPSDKAEKDVSERLTKQYSDLGAEDWLYLGPVIQMQRSAYVIFRRPKYEEINVSLPLRPSGPAGTKAATPKKP
jgi:hypothetical protein